MGHVEPGDLGLRPFPQGEEGPPSLEYIQAKDLFPPKELVKEEENLQVRRSWESRVGGASCWVKNTLSSLPLKKYLQGDLVWELWLPATWSLEGGESVCLHYGATGPREGKAAFLYSCCLVLFLWRGFFCLP